MRQVFLDKGAVVVKKVSQPLLTERSVLVQVHYSCISAGTEIATITHANMGLLNNIPSKVKKVFESVATHGLEVTTALIKSKLKGTTHPLGYSCSGRVLAVGKQAHKFRPGDFVACAGAGYAHHADLVCVPENLVVKIKQESLLKEASLTTIGAVALQGLRRAQIQLGESVAIIGLGLIGQLTIQLAQRAGCSSIIGIDIEHDRIQLAKTCGASRILHGIEDDVVKDIHFSTAHQGVDATIITAASTTADNLLQQAMEITRKKGRVVIVGDVPLTVEREPFYKKEIDLLMSCSYGPGRYDDGYEREGHDYPFSYVRWTENRNMQAFIQLLEASAFNLDPLITHELFVEHADQGYALLQQKKALAVILSYTQPVAETAVDNQPKKEDNPPQKQISFIPAVKDVLRIGFIGTGGFAKTKLMPLISKIANIHIEAVIDSDITASLNAGQTYGAARVCTSDEELYTHDTIDVVVIASPHKYHTEQALRALHNGKAVFLEKPLATNYPQYESFKQFLQEHPHAPLCVDYNRSRAPFIQKIKQVIATRTTPLMIVHRMNAGFISKDHWIQNEIGAGRIIGEACHIIDLFCFLTEAKPLAVSVESMRIARDDLFPTDNFSVQISFDDGSVCTLIYTALGAPKQGKERMEIFYDGKSIVMDDFIHLHGFGLPSWFNQTVSIAHKGHEQLIQEFFKQLRSPIFVSPTPFERLCQVTELTLLIDQLVCEGGGNRELTHIPGQ